MFQEMTFPSINRGYNRVFQPGRLSIGLVAPLENYPSGPVPSMERHLERAQLAAVSYTHLTLPTICSV